MTKNKQTNKDPCLNGSGGGCSMTSPVLFTFLVQNFPFFFFLNISILLIVPEILITYSNALLPSPYILLEEPQKKEKKKTPPALECQLWWFLRASPWLRQKLVIILMHEETIPRVTSEGSFLHPYGVT